MLQLLSIYVNVDGQTTANIMLSLTYFTQTYFILKQFDKRESKLFGSVMKTLDTLTSWRLQKSDERHMVT